MAKTSVIERGKKRVLMRDKYRQKREDLKKTLRASYIKGEIPWEAIQKLQSLPRNSSSTRIQSRCRQCGRPHAVYRKFGLCRLCLRKYAMLGYLPGIVKASW